MNKAKDLNMSVLNETPLPAPRPGYPTGGETGATRLRRASAGQAPVLGCQSARLLAGGLVAAACLLLSGAAFAQPVNLLRFTFGDAPGGTTTASDTSLGGVSATLNMLSGANVATDYHGAAGSGVEGAVNGNRAMTFTNQPSLTTGAQPGNPGPVASLINSSALGFGSITSFVATIWFKQPILMNLSGANVNIGPRLWILNAGATALDSGGSANTIGLKFQTASQLYFQFGADVVTVGPQFPANLPTNTWIFVAVVYDGANASLYYGTETSATRLIGSAASPGRSLNLGSAACLAIGNRASNRARSLDGWVEDFRFYSGAGDLSFVESIRQSAVGGAPTVTGVYPDGSMLQQGTNTLVFTASSPAGTWGPSTNITGIQLLLNGVDVSSQLVTTGPSTNLSVSYSKLPQNVPSITAAITVTDARGLIGTASVVFDTFSPTNFTFEAEEFDYNGGSFIDNPDYTDPTWPADTNSYFGLDSVEGIDRHRGGGNGGTSTADYRAGSGDVTEPQTPPATGELPRLKFIDDPDTNAVDHEIGFWDSADWQNYTKTFPAGIYNIYGRFSAGNGAATIRLDHVVSGQGTSSQTTTNLGSFTCTSGSFTLFQYDPLLDSLGNLASVNIGGVNTLRVTTGGGANANFFMLVPANTNLPIISSVYPDGRVLFEATNKLVFTVSSGATTINTNSVHLTLNGINVSSNLVFSGGPSTWNVSYNGLLINQTYATIISVTDANGNASTSTLSLDTWNPVLQVEAEDFDFDPGFSTVPNPTGGRFIDNPVPTTSAAANSYFGQVGDELVDEHTVAPHTGQSPNNYRPNDFIATTLVTDAARQQFIDAGAPDYNIGFLGGGFWEQYTRTWPAGTYNIYGRMASGIGVTVHTAFDQVTSGWGTTLQLTRHIGTFSCPGNGGYSAYLYVPLMDRFGNYANVTLGGTNTFRTTEDNAVNVNFYMLVAARTDLPRIDSVYPDGSVLQQETNTLSFIASSLTYGLATTNIHVTLNGSNISSSLVFSGSSASWNVSYPGLLPSTAYTAVITITDAHQQTATTTVNFDTFNPNNFTWEAEDFDFDPALSPDPSGNSNRYIDNPAPTDTPAVNSYFNQTSDLGIDVGAKFGDAHPGTYLYRVADWVATEVTVDTPRLRYLNARQAAGDPNIQDYDVPYWTNGAFINFTRTYPAGNYYVYGRLSGGNGAFNLQLAQVTSGWGTMSQTAQYLGTFRGTGTSFATFQYVPLINTNTGLPVALSLGGTNTLQMTADGNKNANFFMLVPAAGPVTLNAVLSGSSIILSFQTQLGLNYTVQYKNNLTDATWTTLGTVPGNGSIESLSDGATASQRFYRLSIQPQ